MESICICLSKKTLFGIGGTYLLKQRSIDIIYNNCNINNMFNTYTATYLNKNSVWNDISLNTDVFLSSCYYLI